MRSSVEAHLERAFALAYFFHPDRETALGIAGQAVTKLRVAERTQGRRAYYRPVGRRLRYDGLIARSRTKVSVERAHMLQRLVLHECDAVEHEQEARAAATLGDDDFALRYVKQLVRLGTRRSSLYVAVAMGRILYGYSTAEVQELIGSVMQDPERVPEDSYLRHVKGSLFDELRSRFGELLRVRTGARGEESFDSAPPSPPQRRLVARCLELLTPWDTACLVPAGFDALSHPLEPFRFSGTDPDDEHAIEVNRMHALIHPGCIERLAGGLRLPSPAARLAVPRPFRNSDLGGGGRGPGGDRERPPELEQNDLDRLGALWSRRDQRRRGTPMARLSVRVDGIERLRLGLEIGATAHCDLGDGADVVEVWGETATGPEVLLAVHLPRLEPFGSREPAAHEEWVIEVGGSRELLLVLRRQADDGGHARLRLDAMCRESSRLAWLTRAWRAAMGRGGPAGPVRWLGAAGAAAAVGVAALLALVLWRGWEEGASRPSTTPPQSTVVGERTRGEAAPTRTTTLATARRIYLASLAGPDGEHVAELLRRELHASGRFEPTSDVEAADAALKVELVPALPGPDGAGGTVARLRLRLVDERGVVLWSADQSGPSWEVMATRAIAALAQAAGG